MFRYSIKPRRGSLTQQTLSGLPSAITHLIPGLPKLNPGLELANTFGVNQKQEVVGLLHRERSN